MNISRGTNRAVLIFRRVHLDGRSRLPGAEMLHAVPRKATFGAGSAPHSRAAPVLCHMVPVSASPLELEDAEKVRRRLGPGDDPA